jgi:O-antigen/teichoic acid export membrane protein
MSLKKQSISGVKWTTISTVISALAVMLKLIVLSRYLENLILV